MHLVALLPDAILLSAPINSSVKLITFSRPPALNSGRIFPAYSRSSPSPLTSNTDFCLSASTSRFVANSAMTSAVARSVGPTFGTPRLMVVSDLDNTMVDHQDGDNNSLKAFGQLWNSEFEKDSLLVYSTGRSPFLYKKLQEEKPLYTPDIVICSVGTEICVGQDMKPNKGWEELLDQGWDRKVVQEEAAKHPKLRPQADSEQRPHKVSFNIEKNDAPPVVEALTASLKERGLKAKIIYSGGYDLDILPEGAGKGKALEYLLKKMREEGRHPLHTLVCGDSGNDVELFTVKDEGVCGVIVGNAMEELVHWHAQQAKEDAEHVFKATERCAAGIMQAMRHFQF